MTNTTLEARLELVESRYRMLDSMITELGRKIKAVSSYVYGDPQLIPYSNKPLYSLADRHTGLLNDFNILLKTLDFTFVDTPPSRTLGKRECKPSPEQNT